MADNVYKIINEVDFEPDEVVVEIGSERAFGSTSYLAEFCKNRQISFYSVDADIAQYDKIKHLSGPYFTAFCMTGEDFLEKIFPKFNKQVKFVYLDNFDWIYEGNENIRRIRKQRERYHELGMEMNNTNSQQAHLQQSMLISKYVIPNGVILFDDTWEPSEGTYNGKGGAAVPWLLNNGFRIYKTYTTADLEYNYVSVIKKA